MERTLVPLFTKVGSQRHMVVLRESFLSIISLILVGSIFLILPGLPGLMDILAPYKQYFDIPFQMTFGLVAVYLSFLIAYNLAGTYKVDQIAAGITSMMVFLITAFFPLVKDGTVYMSLEWLGTWGIFGAIVIGFYTAELFRTMIQKGWYFKPPPGVPPGVTRFIMATLPQLVIMLPVLLITVLGIRIPTLITEAAKPLIVLADTYPAFLLMLFIEHLTWYVGVHSWSLIGPIYFPFIISNQLANAEALAKGMAMRYIATFNTYFGGSAGGPGSHFPMIIFGLRSKSKTVRTVSRAGFIPVLLNINEPVLFGFPVILNPIFFIPQCILAPLIRSLTYVLTAAGLVKPCYIVFFAFVPNPFLWYLGNLDPAAIFWGIIIGYVLPAIAYYPFFKVYERAMIALEQQQATQVGK
jgi:PTS system cellobiose-specific IIC component